MYDANLTFILSSKLLAGHFLRVACIIPSVQHNQSETPVLPPPKPVFPQFPGFCSLALSLTRLCAACLHSCALRRQPSFPVTTCTRPSGLRAGLWRQLPPCWPSPAYLPHWKTITLAQAWQSDCSLKPPITGFFPQPSQIGANSLAFPVFHSNAKHSLSTLPILYSRSSVPSTLFSWVFAQHLLFKGYPSSLCWV